MKGKWKREVFKIYREISGEKLAPIDEDLNEVLRDMFSFDIPDSAAALLLYYYKSTQDVPGLMVHMSDLKEAYDARDTDRVIGVALTIRTQADMAAYKNKHGESWEDSSIREIEERSEDGTLSEEDQLLIELLKKTKERFGH